VKSALDTDLSRVFLNLLLNAAQAMDGNGQIEVSIQSAGDRHCAVSVKDTGPWNRI
jgi:signal transduction histidine kinase